MQNFSSSLCYNPQEVATHSMRVLVTGGAGFLGAHLVDLLLQQQHEVTVVDTAAPRPSGARFVQEDVRSPLFSIFRDMRPEVVVHLAAQIAVPQSWEDPAHDLAVNAGGTVNVVSAAARAGARKVIAISSAAVYGIPAALPLTENSPTGALSPYGLSKLTAESYMRLLCSQWSLSHTILRPANLYGPGQTTGGDGAVVPAFLNGFLSGTDPVIQGDGAQTRDFVYVVDMARAIIQALNRADDMTLNVSSGEGTSVLSLWQMLAGLTGWTRPPVHGPARVGDIRHSVMGNQGARLRLAWSPQVTLQQGLANTVDWAQMQQAAAGME